MKQNAGLLPGFFSAHNFVADEAKSCCTFINISLLLPMWVGGTVPSLFVPEFADVIQEQSSVTGTLQRCMANDAFYRVS